MAFGDVVTELAIDKRKFSAGIAEARAEFGKVVIDAKRMNQALMATGGPLRGGTGGGLGAGVAYGLSDAVTAAQFGGGRAAALSMANNLPQIGEGLGNVAAKFAQGTSAASKFAGVLARFAGPAGLAASVAVPLAAVLAPSLIDFKTAAEEAKEAADGLEKSLEAIRKRQKDAKTLGELRGGSEGQLKTQRDDVTAQRAEVDALRESLVGIAREITYRQKIGDDEFVPGLLKQRDEAEKKLREGQRNLSDAEFALREGEAVQRRKEREASERERRMAANPDTTGRGSKAYREKLEAEERKAAEEGIAAVRRASEANERRGLIAGVRGRLGELYEQRDRLSRPSRSFDRPEAVDRANSMDKLADIISGRGKAEQDAESKKHTTQNEKQIKLLEQLLSRIERGPVVRAMKG